MSREPEEIDPIADARNEIVAIAAFSAWWTPLQNRMRHAVMAAPRAKPWQGPPYIIAPGRRLELSPYDYQDRFRRLRLAKYLVRKAARDGG